MDTLTLTTIVGMVVIMAILLYAYIQTKREIRKEREEYGGQDTEEVLPNKIVTSPTRPRDSYDEYRRESNDIFPTANVVAVGKISFDSLLYSS